MESRDYAGQTLHTTAKEDRDFRVSMALATLAAVVVLALLTGLLWQHAALPPAELPSAALPIVLLVIVLALTLCLAHERREKTRAIHAAAAFRQQCEYWQAIIEHLPHSLIVTDTQGSIVMLNSAAAALLPDDAHADSIGKAYEDVFQHFHDASETGTASVHRVFSTRTGAQRFLKEHSAAVTLHEHPLGAVVLLYDDTDYVELQAAEQLARTHAECASRFRDEVLATISHELRAPLTPILSWTALLKSGQLSENEQAHGLDVIERSARLQAALVSDLMDVSRIIANKLELEREPINLVRLIDAVLQGVRVSAENKRIRLDYTSDDGVRPILGDKNRLQQIFWNLLTNSVKFTPAGGSISVNVARTDAELVVSVADTGEGIAPEFMPRLFEKFSQAESAQPQRTRGLGLGLSIVRHLVEAHGGKVTAQSSGKGQGSTFFVTLPLPAMPLNDEDILPTPVLGMAAVLPPMAEPRKRENALLELSRPSAVG